MDLTGAIRWRENENKKATRITTGIDIDFTKALDQNEESYREEIINWLSDTTNRFADIFSSHLS